MAFNLKRFIQHIERKLSPKDKDITPEVVIQEEPVVETPEVIVQEEPVVETPEVIVQEHKQEIEIPIYDPSLDEDYDVLPPVKKRSKDEDIERKVTLNPLSDE